MDFRSWFDTLSPVVVVDPVIIVVAVSAQKAVVLELTAVPVAAFDEATDAIRHGSGAYASQARKGRREKDD